MASTKIVIGVVLIIIVIVVVVILMTLEVPRSLKFQDLETIQKLDENYHELPRVNSDKRVIITMTTTPDRIDVIYPTLGSLLDQSVRVDEISLNVPYRSRKGIKYEIPKWLKKLKSITIHRVDEDEGPSTKLLPTLRRESSNTRIIVFDDDNIYHSRTVELLVDAFEFYAAKGRRVAVTHYGVMLEENGQIPKFVSWSRARTMFIGPTQVDLLQGCHGFIVTPGLFPPHSLDSSKRPPEAISVDDIWFSCWLQVTGVDIYCLGSTWKHVPLVNFGDVNKTPKLVNGENKGFIRDQKVVNWFMEKHDYIPVSAR